MSGKEIAKRYEVSARRNWLLIILCLILTVILALVFTAMGAADTSVADVCRAAAGWLRGEEPGKQEKVILFLRLPRVVMAVLAGFGLSVSGAAMQGVTRNSLVSPFTIGISNAAAFGASLSIVFGMGLFAGTEAGIVLNAFIWAMGCTVLVYMISLKVGMGPEAIVLTGIALNYLFSAATSTIEFFASEHKLAQVVQWAFGSLNGAQWQEAGTVAVVVLVCLILLYFHAPALNVMSSGDDEVAKSLGILVESVRVQVGILSVLMTAAVISFTGVIGFVGLAGPHIARMIIGNDHRYLLPFSAVTGAILMLVADTIGRLILAPVTIPVGIIISFLGVPIFINLILSKRKGYFQ